MKCDELIVVRLVSGVRGRCADRSDVPHTVSGSHCSELASDARAIN